MAIQLSNIGDFEILLSYEPHKIRLSFGILGLAAMDISAKQLFWLMGAGYMGHYMRTRINSALAKRRRRHVIDPEGELLRLLCLYGYNSHSLVSIAPGTLVWSTPDIDGAVVYSEFGRVWLASGDPLAPTEDIADLTRQFAEFAKKRRRLIAFAPSTAAFARLVTPNEFTCVKIGAAPYFDLRTWRPHGDSAKKIRAGVNQARRAGVKIEEVSDIDPTFEMDATQLCEKWLRTRRAATGFAWMVSLNPFLHREYKKFFAARIRDRLVGFIAASPIPCRRGWYLEDIIRDPNAPKGTATLLVVETLAALRADGAHIATLGTAALAKDGPDDISTGHPTVARALDAASQRLSAFYNFAGVRRFKASFAPSWWESEYALGQDTAAMPLLVARAVLRALVPGGVTQLLTRKTLRVISGNESLYLA